jgi:tetratricopeptide (TPR) repeat protein/predicted aspartyl protease
MVRHNRDVRFMRWLRCRLLCCVLAPLSVFIASVPALAACKLGRIAEFPITMEGLRPLMSAKINDHDVQFVVDSGAFWSMMSAASVSQLNLPTHSAPFGFYVTGAGGTSASVSIATVKVLMLAGQPLHNVEFLAGGSDAGGYGSIGLLGQNVLHVADVEYDLGAGFVRLMKPDDCSKSALAYWVAPGMSYSVMDLSASDRAILQTRGVAYVNGSLIRVVFDTGAWASTLSLKAAARVGIKPDSPGVVAAGVSSGIGKGTYQTYIAPFASFKIGDEEIRNTRLRIGDIDLEDADMLIGPDFFLSHRIYVANSQHKLYFTYNGGPVFKLDPGVPIKTDAVPALDASPEDAKSASPGPGDAADYGRRGAAFAARREFEPALAALTRACELAPDNPEYHYQRGMVYWQMRQAAPAMADFDRALELKPDNVMVRVSRAGLLLQGGDKARAAADLDAAAAAAPREADAHFEIAQLYEGAGLPKSAIAQYDLWIAYHDVDARLPRALNGRCWVRALEGTDLALAKKDCDAALKRADKSTSVYAQFADSRGLVLLRLGEYDKSIADYDASLKINPKNAWSWYGRGVDKLRKQKTAEGEADMAQATALWAGVAEEFKRRGITP